MLADVPRVFLEVHLCSDNLLICAYNESSNNLERVVKLNTKTYLNISYPFIDLMLQLTMYMLISLYIHVLGAFR